MRAVLARRHWQVCLLVFLIVRVASVWNRPVARFPDSVGYETLSIFGTADRFWPTTLVFWLIRNDTARVIAQVGIQVVAFAFLATAVAALCNKSWWAGLPVLVVACAPQVARFDLAILSESLGISYLAFALGSVILVLRRQTSATVSLVIVSISLFAMTRPPQFPALVVASVGAAIVAATRRTRRATICAAILVVLTEWGAIQIRNNEPMSTLVYYTVLADRIIPDERATEWFVSHGMPVSPAILSSHAYVYPRDLSPELIAELKLPKRQMPPSLMRAGGFELANWVKSRGWATYGRYVVSHPLESLRLVGKKWDSMLNPSIRQLLAISSRNVLPQAVFGNALWWAIAALVSTLALIILRLSTRIHLALACLGAGTFAWFATVAHTSGIEHARHAITVAVAIRLIAVITIVFTVTTLKDRYAHNG